VFCLPGGIFLATDLADNYDYICTKIPTPNGKICIETHKHSHKEWYHLLASSFYAVDVQAFAPSQLRNRGFSTPKSLREDLPLFQLITARRN
jgi:hypothetical protein